MRLSWGVRTDRGRLRTLNEDAVLARPPVFVVADGMGGHAAGEVASALVIDGFTRLAQVASGDRGDVVDATHPDGSDGTDGTGDAPGTDHAPGLAAEAVVRALEEINARILDHTARRPEAAGMGTTVSGVVVVDNGGGAELLAFNIGDSRLYRLRERRLEQVSVDHSAVQELVDDGLLEPAAARLHPARHIVTRALGSVPAPQPDLWFITPRAGDRFLLCTDGLSGEVSDDALFVAVLETADPDALAQRLVDLALRSGGRDNISVIVLDVVQVDAEEDDGSTAPRGDTAAAFAGATAGAVEETTQPRTGVDPA